jgi:hypothetical protein
MVGRRVGRRAQVETIAFVKASNGLLDQVGERLGWKECEIKKDLVAKWIDGMTPGFIPLLAKNLYKLRSMHTYYIYIPGQYHCFNDPAEFIYSFTDLFHYYGQHIGVDKSSLSTKLWQVILWDQVFKQQDEG